MFRSRRTRVSAIDESDPRTVIGDCDRGLGDLSSAFPRPTFLSTVTVGRTQCTPNYRQPHDRIRDRKEIPNLWRGVTPSVSP